MTTPASGDDTLGLGSDFAANKADRSNDLSGSELTLAIGPAGEKVTLSFTDAYRLTQTYDGRTIETDYEALRVADNLFLIAISDSAAPEGGATSVVADFTTGAALHVRNVLGPKVPGTPRVVQTVNGAVIDGVRWTGPEFARTSALSGRRAMWVYSENDVYEHIYLNNDWYAWHCLAGEEYPLADVDPCKVYAIRDGVFALTFTEKVMSMAATMILDFNALRSYCAAYGGDTAAEARHFTFGAHGRILSQTDYPSPLTA